MKKFLMLQKEGILLGALWGFISIYAALGMISTLDHLSIIHKLLILPVWIGGFLVSVDSPTILVMAMPILVGALIGMVIDMIYKPTQ